MNRLFEISKSGLASAQRSLTVTSNNIVNADSPGYTRQRVDKMPVGLNTGMTSIGLGVNISTATRLRNDMNDVLTNQKRQEFGFMNYKSQVYERLQATMTTDSGGDLDVRISRFFDMFSELANDPQDISVRNSLISEAQQLTSKFMNIDQSLSDTGELVADTALTTITDINNLLRDIQALNESVVQSTHRGAVDSTSLDIRVKKLEELAQLVDFTQMNANSGAVEIRIGGIRVLDDEHILELRSEVSPNDQQFKVRAAGGTIIDIKGGELGAQIDMYTNNIPDFRSKLDELANTLVTEINSIHSSDLFNIKKFMYTFIALLPLFSSMTAGFIGKFIGHKGSPFITISCILFISLTSDKMVLSISSTDFQVCSESKSMYGFSIIVLLKTLSISV